MVNPLTKVINAVVSFLFTCNYFLLSLFYSSAIILLLKTSLDSGWNPDNHTKIVCMSIVMFAFFLGVYEFNILTGHLCDQIQLFSNVYFDIEIKK